MYNVRSVLWFTPQNLSSEVSNMEMLRIGIIGCGGIAYRRTIPGMMLSKNSELVAVMDTNFEAAVKTKEEFGAKYTFDKESISTIAYSLLRPGVTRLHN